MIVIALIAITCSAQITKARALSFTSTGSIDGNNTFECKKNITLNCKSNTTDNFSLNINGSQAVVCISSCIDVDPGNFTVSHNSTSRLINLYLTSVTTNDEYTIFSCEEGLKAYPIQPKIKIFPRTGSAAMSENLDGNNVQIIVTTGCMLLQEAVTFNWRKIRKDIPNSEPEPLLKDLFNQTDMQNNTFCDSTSNCGATGMSSVLKFRKANDGEGEDCYIQLTIVVHDDHAPEKNITLVSSMTFQLLKDITTGITTDTTNISPSITTVTTSYVAKSSTREMKTTTTTSNANANPSLTTRLPTTTTSNANTSVLTNLPSTSEEPRKSDQEKRILIYVFAPLGSVIVIVIIIYVISINFRKEETKDTNKAV